MKNICKIFLLVLIFSNFSISQEVKDYVKYQEPRKILFIGNSYLYYGDSLHNHFKRMAEEYLEDYDGSASVKSATIGGARLKHHDVERLIKPKAISSIEKFDLIILDIMMPGIDGITFLKRFREKNQTTPVLMLSAIKNTNSKIKTFNLGCDDYLVKPFEPEELLLRINRLISPRTNKKFRKRVNFGEFEFDFDLGELKKKNKNIKLTTNELIILSYMCNNLNKTLTRDDLIYQLKNQNQSRTIDVVVTRLRKKIENDDKSSFLKTVRGKGYMLNSDYEN